MEKRRAARTYLNLGCGNAPVKGAVNHDIVVHADFVDVAHDLTVYPWPWDDDSFDVIYAQDLLEHLPSFLDFFNEAWRIARPDARIYVRTPLWNSINAVIDPTHIRCYHPESFHYLDPSTVWGQKYSMYTDRKWRIIKNEIDGINMVVILEVMKA